MLYHAINEMDEKPLQSCGTLNADGLVTFNPEFTKLINFYGEDLSCLHIETKSHNGWYHMDTTGHARGGAKHVGLHCMGFSNHVSVTYIDDKAAYFNRDFDIVKRTPYIFAGSFHEGIAKVCSAEAYKKYEGEHYELVGGKCGFIDDSFDEIIETKYPFETTPVPTGNLYYALEPMEWLTTLASLGAAAIPQKNTVLDVVYDYKTYAIDADGDKLASPYTEQERKGYVHGVTFRLKDQSVWVALIKEDLGNARTVLSVKPQ